MPLYEGSKENIAYQIRGTFRAFENALISYLASKDVPVAYFHILRLAWNEEGIAQKEISKLAFMSPSVTSQLIQKMCREGLLERKQKGKDSRKKHVFMTEKGLELRKEVVEGALQIPLAATKGICNKDIETTIKVLNSIRCTLKSQ